MNELRTVDEIEIDYSKSQIYWRIKKLVESGVMDPPERGERNQYLLGPEEVGLLKNLSEVEQRHDSVKEAITELKEKGAEKLSEDNLRKRVDELENKVDGLEERIELLEQKLSLQTDRLQSFRDRWTDQLKEGAQKVKDLFG